MLLIIKVFTAGDAGAAGSRPALAPAHFPGFRTDRLSEKQLRTWRKITAVVRAEDPDGQPLHPTLRQLWDAIETSRHTIFVEMSDSRSYFAGRFEMTAVDPEGRAHEGVILLNLRAIDRTATGPAAARDDGFVPFERLRRHERYAEVLGHELAHAVWHLASNERARLAQRLQGQLEEQARTLLASARSDVEKERIPESDLDRLSRALEGPAEATERAIWAEIRASRRRR